MHTYLYDIFHSIRMYIWEVLFPHKVTIRLVEKLIYLSIFILAMEAYEHLRDLMSYLH